MNKPLVTQGSEYSDEQRRAAIACYVVHGNFKRCSELLGMPARTMQQWGKTEWWLNQIAEVRAEKQDEIDAGISNIIDLAINSVSKRLKDGDEVLDSKGNVSHRAVSARDSATILGISFDKQRILRMLPTVITHTGNDSKLLKLQVKFEELASAKVKEIDGSIVTEG